MDIDTLIELLKDAREEMGGDAEVRLMTQHNWPFENAVFGVTTGAEINNSDDEDDEEDQNVENDNTIYIVEGQQLCYGSKNAWNVARTC